MPRSALPYRMAGNKVVLQPLCPWFRSAAHSGLGNKVMRAACTQNQFCDLSCQQDLTVTFGKCV
jgi:hypothetical protein